MDRIGRHVCISRAAVCYVDDEKVVDMLHILLDTLGCESTGCRTTNADVSCGSLIHLARDVLVQVILTVCPTHFYTLGVQVDVVALRPREVFRCSVEEGNRRASLRSKKVHTDDLAALDHREKVAMGSLGRETTKVECAFRFASAVGTVHA